MNKYKNKIFIGLCIFIALCISYFSGGDNLFHSSEKESYSTVTSEIVEASPQVTSDTKNIGNEKQENQEKGRQEKSEKGVKEKAAKEATKKAAKAAAAKEAAKEASSKGQASLNPKMTQKPAATVSQSEKKQETKDQYLTDPVPEGKPEPVEPQDVTVTHKAMKCTLSVSCDTILTHMEDLVTEKVSLVPEDGVLFKAQEVTFYEGESVFDVLLREMKNHKIHMEFVNTPIYNSAYIEGMGNLYEFDCGQLSGWMYKVNGWFPNYGCSRYMLQDGDKVEWVYTCDLGRDVGGYIEGMEGE